MKGLAVIVLVIGAAAAWPSVAAAKELTRAKICGAAGCTTVSDRKTLNMLPAGGDTSGSPPPAAPFYTLHLTVEAEGRSYHFRTWFVPSSNMVANRDESGQTDWYAIFGAPSQKLMRTLVRGLAPFPRPVLTRVTVNGEPAADPGSYLSLLSIRSDEDALPGQADWQRIELSSARPTPWTNGATYVTYSPSANLLWRGPDLIPLPDALAARLEARESLTIPSGGFPWRYFVLAVSVLGAAAAAGGFGIVLTHRTRDVAPRPKTTPA